MDTEFRVALRLGAVFKPSEVVKVWDLLQRELMYYAAWVAFLSGHDMRGKLVYPRSMTSKTKTRACLEEESAGIDTSFQLDNLTMSWTLREIKMGAPAWNEDK